MNIDKPVGGIKHHAEISSNWLMFNLFEVVSVAGLHPMPRTSSRYLHGVIEMLPLRGNSIFDAIQLIINTLMFWLIPPTVLGYNLRDKNESVLYALSA